MISALSCGCLADAVGLGVELVELVSAVDLLATVAAGLLSVAAGVAVVAVAPPENALSNGGSQKYNPTSNNKPSTPVLAALAFMSRASC